jgi:hypothetical protein
MPNKTRRAPLRYKSSAFFSSLLEHYGGCVSTLTSRRPSPKAVKVCVKYVHETP